MRLDHPEYLSMSTTERLIVRGTCAHDCPDGCSFISEV
jgi:hypothetical protein